MKPVLSLLVLVVHAVLPLRADSLMGQCVRPLDSWAAESLERGLHRTAIVPELVALLDASDLIVHVQTTLSLPANTAGTTQLAGRVGRWRYVRIHLDRTLLPDERAAILAHELHHALEVAHSDVWDEEGFRRLFERIGHQATPGTYETMAARRAGERAWVELRSGAGVGRIGRAKRAGERMGMTRALPDPP